MQQEDKGSSMSDKTSQHWDQGSEAFKSKNYREALTHFRIVLEAVPDDVRTLSRVATCCYKLRDFPGAIKYFGKAIELSPKDKDLLYTLGLIYIRAGEKTKALSTYDKLKKIHVEKAEELYKAIYA